MQPTSSSERLPFLDAMRGFALCGILLANLLSFMGAVYLNVDELNGLSWLARCILFAIDFFIEGKFYTLFSILFGIGCALSWQRHACISSQFLTLWYRRMSVLLVFGLVHMVLIWYGDILTLYACLGLLLPILIKLKRDAMLSLALALLVVPIVMFAIRYQTSSANFWQLANSLVSQFSNAWGLGGMSRMEMFTNTDSLTVLQANVTGALQRPMSYLQTGRAFKVLGQFLLGFWFGLYMLPRVRNGWRPTTGFIIIFSVIALVANFIYAWIKNSYASPFMLTPIGAYQNIAYHVGSNTMPIVYAFVLGLLWKTQKTKRLLQPLIILGRMSLSNYLMQSIIGVSLFFGYGTALMGRLPFEFLPLIALTILVFQWQFGKYWLRHHVQGSCEAIWRRLTYNSSATTAAKP